MKKLISLVALIFSLTGFANFDLSIADRDTKAKKKIDEAFEALSKKEPEWRVIGTKKYQIAFIDEYKLVSGMIKEQSDRKEFYVMDIGAGDFSFAKEFCRELNDDKSISGDVKVYLLSLRGEPNKDQNEILDGKCHRHDLGAFKIEDIANALQERNFEMTNKVDLIVSNFTFRHLVDPVGTLRETYKLLRPHTGVLIVDGFFFKILHPYEKELMGQNRLLYDALRAMGASLMMHRVTVQRASSYPVVMMKSNETIGRLPLAYTDQSEELGTYSYGQTKLHFALEEGFKTGRLPSSWNKATYGGDKSVYDYLTRLDAWNNIKDEEDTIKPFKPAQ